MPKKPRKFSEPDESFVRPHPHPLLESETVIGKRVIWKYITGRVAELPDGIAPYYPDAKYDEDTRDFVDELFDDNRTETLGSHAGSDNHRVYKLLTTISPDGFIAWIAHSGGQSGHAACGYLELKNDTIVASAATAFAAHQHQGIYSTVLKLLRKHYDIPLSSDELLSPGALLTWMSVGVWSPERRSYRLNPSTPRLPKHWKKAVHGALDLAYSEAAMRDRVRL